MAKQAGGGRERTSTRTGQVLRRRPRAAPLRDLVMAYAGVEWFVVIFDEKQIVLDVRPPEGQPWKAGIPWDTITRICFVAEGPAASDGIYLFTTTRPESWAIPTEAVGGQTLWGEIVRRDLFDPSLANTAATSTEEAIFCWPPTEGGILTGDPSA